MANKNFNLTRRSSNWSSNERLSDALQIATGESVPAVQRRLKEERDSEDIDGDIIDLVTNLRSSREAILGD